MYKYYDILNKKEKVIISDPKQTNYTEIQYNLPVEFFQKNATLFNELKTIFDTYCLVSEESIYDRLEGTIPYSEIYEVVKSHRLIRLRRGNKPYDGIYEFIDDFYRVNTPTNYLCENYLCDMLGVIKNLIDIYPHNREYYTYIYNETSRVYSELRKTNCILVDNDHIVFEIPNAWYLTNNGTLYNSMGEHGHLESNLAYPIHDITTKVIDRKNLLSEKEKYLELYNEIKEKEYITKNEYVDYLNWSGQYDSIIKDRIYHKVIVDLVLGIIKAHADLFDSFNKLNETDDFDESLKKLFEITKSQIDDILIRFCGMSKVKASGLPFICTTNTYDFDFKEYTDRGYHVDLIDPIIVEDGEVKVRDLTTHRTIRKVLNR